MLIRGRFLLATRKRPVKHEHQKNSNLDFRPSYAFSAELFLVSRIDTTSRIVRLLISVLLRRLCFFFLFFVSRLFFSFVFVLTGRSVFISFSQLNIFRQTVDHTVSHNGSTDQIFCRMKKMHAFDYKAFVFKMAHYFIIIIAIIVRFSAVIPQDRHRCNPSSNDRHRCHRAMHNGSHKMCVH